MALAGSPPQIRHNLHAPGTGEPSNGQVAAIESGTLVNDLEPAALYIGEAPPRQGRHMFRFGHHAHYAHHPVFGILILILLIALLALAIVGLIRLWKPRPGHPSPARAGTSGSVVDPALTELRIRYARGDITAEEYSQRASHLGYQGPSAFQASGPPTQSPPPAS